MAGGERFTAFLAHHYHSLSDDLSLPFNWRAGARFARLNYLIAREIADGATLPRWYRGQLLRRRVRRQPAARAAGSRRRSGCARG